MNKCTFIGNLTHDPEARTTATGKNVTTINIAINDNETTTYLRIKAWGTIAPKNLKKGDKIFVVATIKNNVWTDKQGVKRYDLDLIADFICTSKIADQEIAERLTDEDDLPF